MEKTSNEDLLEELEKYLPRKVRSYLKYLERQLKAKDRFATLIYDEIPEYLKKEARFLTSRQCTNNLVFNPNDDILEYYYDKINALKNKHLKEDFHEIETKVLLGLPEDLRALVPASIDEEHLKKNLLNAYVEYKRGFEKNAFAMYDY